MDGRLILALALALGGCATTRPTPVALDWRSVATRADVARIARWRDALTAGLRTAERAGARPAIVAAGPLLEPDSALAGAMPPPGSYACATTKLGAKQPGLLDHIAYPPFRCTVHADGRFTKDTGSQRQVGRLFAHQADRAIFLGTLALGDERAALPYGVDAQRDVAGVVQRVAPATWRIVFPDPAFESLVDVLSLRPAP